MGSNAKEVQFAQIERAQQELSTRLSSLAERGVGEADVDKDRVVRHLRSNIKQWKSRVRSIETQVQRRQAAADKKAARLAAPKVKKTKGGKAAEAPAPSKKSEKAKKKAKPAE